MNEALKNPFLVFIAGLIGIYLVIKVLGMLVNLGWIIILAFVILFLVNPRFRGIVQRFLASLFRK